MPEDSDTPPEEIPPEQAPEVPDIPETPAEVKEELESTSDDLDAIGEELIDAYMRLERAEERIEILESYFMSEEENEDGKRDDRTETPAETSAGTQDRPPAAGHRYWRRRDK